MIEKIMKDNRKKIAKLNMRVSLLCQVVTVVCAIIIPRCMLVAFGSELYGATASITQFLSYITLIEGGIGGVARAALYKPLASNENDRICEIFWELKRFFNIIGCIFIVYAFIIAVFFKQISSIDSIDWITTFLLVIVISISICGQHFIGISNAVVLQASQKIYITNLVSVIATIINTCLVIILIKVGCGIIFVKLASSCIFLLRPIALSFYVKKSFHIKKPTNKTTHLRNKWDGLGQHISFFLHSNVDVVILTLLGNLELVAVYSVYRMIISNVQNIIVSFTSGMEAYFGDMLAKKEYDNLIKQFRSYEVYIMFISTVLLSATLILIIPFVKLYTNGINDADYIVPAFATVMILATFMYCVRQPFHSVIIAAGHFKETNFAAYGEVVINVLISVLMVYEFGLIGVAVGTFIAVLFRFAYYVWYLSRNILKRRPSIVIKQMIFSAVVLSLSVGGLVILDRSSVIDTYGQWIVLGFAVTLGVCLITIGLNYLIFRDEYLGILKSFLR